MRHRRDQSSPESSARAQPEAARPADGRRAQHDRHRAPQGHRDRRRTTVAGTRRCPSSRPSGSRHRAPRRWSRSWIRFRRLPRSRPGRMADADLRRYRTGSSRGAPDSGRHRRRPARRRHVERQSRQRGAASGARAADSGADSVPGVPSGVRVGASADGCDQSRRRRIRELDRPSAAAEPAQGIAGRRRPGGRRQRAGVPAADHHSVLLHLAARGLGLSSARRIPARSADGQRGTCPDAPSFRSCRVLPAPFPASWRRAPFRIRATDWRPS